MTLEEEEKAVSNLDALMRLLVDIWTVYLKWFTFFYLANLGVMSWLFLKDKVDTSRFDGGIKFFMLTWALMNAIGLLYSIALFLHSKNVALHARKIISTLTHLDQREQKLKFPVFLSTTGALFNALSYVVNIVLWVILFWLW